MEDIPRIERNGEEVVRLSNFNKLSVLSQGGFSCGIDNKKGTAMTITA
jgi:hypothetical protein